jgi:hypothetical protein
MAPKPKLKDAPPTAPNETEKDGSGRLETYEHKVERASVESFAEHPEGSAPPLERLVEAEEEKKG